MEFDESNAGNRPTAANDRIRSAPETMRNPSGRGRATIEPRLSEWIDGIRKTGARVPAHARRADEPDFRAIAREIGCSGQLLADPNRGHRGRIETVAREVGLTEVPTRAPPDRGPVIPRLSRFLETPRDRGGGVPESRERPGEPDYASIAKAIGVSVRTLRSPALPFRGLILAAVVERGLAPVESVEVESHAITIAELAAAIGRERPVAEVGNLTAKARRLGSRNSTWALNALVGRYAPSLACAARPALARAIEDLERTKGRERRLLTELRRGLRTLEKIEALGLPQTFAAALNFLITRSDTSISALAREINVSRAVVGDWAIGRRNPNRDASTKLATMERMLGAPVGSLVERHRESLRAPPPMGRGRRDPIATSSVKSGRRGPPRGADSAFPPDWPMERDAQGAFIYRRPSSWPSPLREERDAFLAFRSDTVAPLGLSREGALWAPDTCMMRDAELGRLFSYIARNYHPFLAKPERLSLAILISSHFVHAHIEKRVAARGARTGVTRLTRPDLALMETARAIFHPRTGWMSQRPELAKRLVPVADRQTETWIVSPDDVASAREAPHDASLKSGWSRLCEKAYESYDRMCRAHRRSVVVQTDHSAIEAILRLPDPAVAFGLGWDGLTREIRNLRRDSQAYRVAVRDKVLWGIAAQTAFREENYALDWDADNSGHLVWRDGKFILSLPRRLFKNRGGPYFREGGAWRDYYRVLIDDDGFYDTIREYIDDCRPLMVKAETRALFVSQVTGEGLGRAGLGRAITATYRRHVMWDPDRKSGIEGAGATGPHWVRAVRATSVLKMTGDVYLAADSIHDSVETVLTHYIRYVPSDREDRLSATLTASLASSRGGAARRSGKSVSRST